MQGRKPCIFFILVADVARFLRGLKKEIGL